jgi:hypothetical protein
MVTSVDPKGKIKLTKKTIHQYGNRQERFDRKSALGRKVALVERPADDRG